MILRYQRCRGLRLWRWGRVQLEVWWYPRDEVIPMHCHDEFDSWICHLWGVARWRRGRRERLMRCWDIGYARPVAAGEEHGAMSYTWGMFLNVQRWKHDRPTSASVDFRVSG